MTTSLRVLQNQEAEVVVIDEEDLEENRGVFKTLPEHVVDYIVSHASYKDCLSVSKFFRDRVFHQLKGLTQNEHKCGRHTTSFLDRACSSAPPGLALRIGNVSASQMNELTLEQFKDIMTRALDKKWKQVEELKIRWAPPSSFNPYMDRITFTSFTGYPLTYLGMAFPHLRRLHIGCSFMDLSFFLSLRSCCHLQELQLDSTVSECISECCIIPAAEALQGVTSLQKLGLQGSSSFSQLLKHSPKVRKLHLANIWVYHTGAASAHAAGVHQQYSWWDHVCQNSQLQSLSVFDGLWYNPTLPQPTSSYRQQPWPFHMRQLLSTCSQLVQLDLSCTVDVQTLQVLLSHGNQLRQVHLGEVVIDAPLPPQTKCHWTHLKLRSSSLRQIAYLPLQSLQSLIIGSSPIGTLSLPFGTSPDRVTALLDRAAANLAQSPVWQQLTQPVTICLMNDIPQPRTRCFGFSLTPLLATLAPLATHHQATAFRAVLFGEDWQLKQSDVQTLARIFGPKLSHVYLDGVSLHDSSWTALSSDIPALQSLELHGEEGTVKLDSWDLVAYCIRRGRSPPHMSLITDGWLSPEFESRGAHQVEEQLNALIWAQGSAHITVRVVWEDG